MAVGAPGEPAGAVRDGPGAVHRYLRRRAGPADLDTGAEGVDRSDLPQRQPLVETGRSRAAQTTGRAHEPSRQAELPAARTAAAAAASVGAPKRLALSGLPGGPGSCGPDRLSHRQLAARRQPFDDTVNVGSRPVLAELGLGLDPADDNFDPDDGTQLPGHEG